MDGGLTVIVRSGIPESSLTYRCYIGISNAELLDFSMGPPSGSLAKCVVQPSVGLCMKVS